MKVITLWQPWASFIACGIKTIETRTHDRFKNLKGETIGIHAGKSWDKDWVELAGRYLRDDQIMDVLTMEYLFKKKSPLVFGCLMATAHVQTTGWLFTNHSMRALINCDEDRFGLFLENIRRVKPITIEGHQGIWNYNGEIIYL